MLGSSSQKHGHVALVPSAGMGHLTPFLRLASSLLIASDYNLKITIITPNPTLSHSESQTLIHFSNSFPQITQIPLPLVPSQNTPISNSQDPVFHHMERIRNSSHLLHSLLPSLSPPLSALITDISLIASILPITQSLNNLPNYVFFTSSAQMLTLFAYYHSFMDSIAENIPFPRSWIPPPLLEKTEHSLKTYIAENGKMMGGSTGIMVNTFQSIELSSLSKLNGGEVIAKLPPVIAIGALAPLIDEGKEEEAEEEEYLTWLGRQPAGSVVYVSFGSRTAMSREQLRELGEGLVMFLPFRI